MTSELLLNPVSSETHQSACSYRLNRVRQQLLAAQVDAILLYDPVNIRYATDTSNMQVWTMHNFSRYVLLFDKGPVILSDFVGCEHLSAGNPQIDEYRDCIDFSFFSNGFRVDEKCQSWADSLLSDLSTYAGKKCRLAVDKGDFGALSLLADKGVEICNGQSLMEQARLIKSEDELELMQWTMRVCEAGMQKMYDENKAGMTEQQLWAWLHHENIRNGGEWIETRLVASGTRTNPWMQEASDRVMQAGELFCFDTDLIGPYGYIADVSRAWTVGHVAPTEDQKSLYRLAYDQIMTNADLIKPGVSYREFSEKAWPIPERFYDNRYCFIMHGVGMCDEFPGVAHWGEDWEKCGNEGVIEENMTLSVESYIGERDGKEGVKLEQQYRVTSNGVESMCEFPWQLDWLE